MRAGQSAPRRLPQLPPHPWRAVWRCRARRTLRSGGRAAGYGRPECRRKRVEGLVEQCDTTPDRPAVGVLRDYPLRLCERQRQYTEGLLHEFKLLLIGEESGELHRAAPGQVVQLAEKFTNTYGPQLTAINEERQQALNRGLDRIDSTSR